MEPGAYKSTIFLEVDVEVLIKKNNVVCVQSWTDLWAPNKW